MPEFWTFLVLLALACSLPHREVIARVPSTPVRSETLVQSRQNPKS
jgi:hypothetical protein